MDGMRSHFALDRGLWKGVLHLMVVEDYPGGSRAYGVKLQCEAYAAFEEMVYSIADHGAASGTYDGDVYIKEAERSALLDAYVTVDPLKDGLRHFLFVGTDYCYEVLAYSEPEIMALPSIDEAYEWRPDQSD
jgi:hypothetical protein